MRSNRLVHLTGALIGLGAIAGWVVAKASGIPFIDGLDDAEAVQTADAVAAALALVSALSLGVFAIQPSPTGCPAHADVAHERRGGRAGRLRHVRRRHPHPCGRRARWWRTRPQQGLESSEPPTLIEPYDGTLPVNLAGVEGVTPAQQAAAEGSSRTIQDLPQWSDPQVALAAGFHSIGDGATGIEHFVNEEYMTDESFLDPNRPESLVWDTTSGSRRLVAAMYMAEQGLPLDEVPTSAGT